MMAMNVCKIDKAKQMLITRLEKYLIYSRLLGQAKRISPELKLGVIATYLFVGGPKNVQLLDFHLLREKWLSSLWFISSKQAVEPSKTANNQK